MGGAKKESHYVYVRKGRERSYGRRVRRDYRSHVYIDYDCMGRRVF